ncbi:MAG: SusC/RagA family TonB-linked outer membrane protein [Bacteroidales bacterium]|nr:SusC/RagA family TonB-linked outer membrane protein [Bacteroidales bacterium]
MKLSVLLTCILSANLMASAYSQKARFDLNINDQSIRDVFKTIENESEFRFFYNDEFTDLDRKLSFSITNKSIDDLMSLVLDNTSVGYKVLDNNLIVISPKLLLEQRQVKGIVTDNKGNPLPGVNVFVKGTTIGSITGLNGEYSITMSENSETLVFSFIGMSTQEVSVGAQTVINVILKESEISLQEVVVTALGIKKDAKALGYSVSKVNGEDVAQSHETNVANALSGKVSGVFVSRPASGAAGSSKVVIRGNNSLRTNSQPLYVVDGVPITNLSSDASSQWGGFDYGDGISNINPEDIETMSVLKGPNATALYGQRGNNGVILITTKSGSQKKRMGVNFSSDYAVGTGLILPDFQNEYGQGYNGNFTNFRGDDGKVYTMAKAIELGLSGMPQASAGRDKLTRGSWGAKMEGQQYKDQFGHVSTFDPQPNTYDFFQPDKTLTNNLSIDGGVGKTNYRFSASNMHNDGYVPTNKMDRNTFNLKVNSEITPKFHLEAMANYVNQKVKNRPRLSDANDNPAYLFISQPRSLSLESLQNYAWTKEEISNQLGFSSSSLYEGLEKPYATNSSTANPYWTINRTHNEDERDRIIGYFKLSYDIAPWLKVTAKTGTDYYNDQKLFYRNEGTWSTTNKNGDYQESFTRTRETNSDILFSSNFKVGENFDISLNAGGNRQKFSSRRVGHSGNEFIIPDLHVINNIKTLSYIYGLSESAINSVYGSGQVAFKNYLYVDFSGRNDWSSTLPSQNCSFFYPSVGVSFVVTDAFKLKQDWLSFLKVRASVAQAGSSGDPYALVGTYYLDANKLNGIALGSYTSNVVDPNLQNELTTSYEGGVDLSVLNNRLKLDLTVYKSSTKNQILSITLPASTTFSSRTINAGEIQNQGIELMISGTPVKTSSGFTWESTFNFSRNRNEVVSLVEGVDAYILAQDRGTNVVAAPGKPFGEIWGVKYAWIKDSEGNRLIDPNTGLPLRSSGFVTTDLGSALPDWLGGFTNTFFYKGFSFSALIDISQGGKVFSQSMREEILYGTTKKTLPGRDGTYVAEGMVAQSNGEGGYTSTGVKNTKQVTAQNYWNMVAGDKENFVSEEMINDLSYISMREMSLSYTIPTDLLKKTFIRNIVLGVYGRNLFYFQRNTDGFSPEACSFNVHNSSLGLESTSYPLMRTFGCKISLEL